MVRIDERLDGDRVKVRDLATGESSEVSLSSLQGRSAVAEGAKIDAHLEVTRASTDIAWRRATTREQALGALLEARGHRPLGSASNRHCKNHRNHAQDPIPLAGALSRCCRNLLPGAVDPWHPRRHDRKNGIETRPVMIVQFPSGPDERRLFARILRALGAPFSGYWRIDALETATLNALALVRVQVLVIEEFQQLLAGNARAQRISLNLIKTIANDLRISIVGVGTDEARYAIDADAQIRRRFDPFALPRWTETEDFRDFVSAFGKIFPLRKASLLGERALVQRLLQASEGITGLVTRMLSLAAVEAIRTSTERIDAAGIDRAAKRLEDDFK